jgi:AGZA family xanthine/uracil permease-like MFS transporter
MGNPYINAVYIGHPGWKAMGGRIGYSAATGIMVIALSWFGVISLMTAVIPIVAISPILLYIGMLIGSQAFQESPRRHAPAIVVALVPSIAAWGKLQIDNTLGAVSNIHQVTPEMIASMKQVGVMYQGLAVLGAGSILSGVILGSVTTYIVERKFARASAFAAAGALLTSFGLMHGEEVDPSRIQNPGVVAAYLLVAGVLFACHRFGVVGARAEEHDGHEIGDGGHEKDGLAAAE